MPMSVQSSSINEEIGQVKYIFSDKTGTLTCNVMEFKNFSTTTRSYEADDRPGSRTQLVIRNKNHPENKNINGVLRHLALCHAMILDPRTKKYNSSSPDELALVEGAKSQGYEFLNKDPQNIISIKTPFNTLRYELLNVLEFTSTRKRMSVIIKDLQNGEIWLFTKGADSVI